MFAIDFGQFCFNEPASEQSITLVIAPKKEYESMDDFVTAALDYLESDGEFDDKWNEYYKERTYSEVKEDELKWMLSRFDALNQKVSVLHGQFVKVLHIVPPQWNDITLGIETEQEYIFYVWGTSE